MVVLGEPGDHRRGSYATELEPLPPFWALGYVSATDPRKDYVDSFAKYERELRVPYYLIFDPDAQGLRLYRHDGSCYRQTPPTAEGRHAVPELELEVGLRGGWVRYWHRGELLGLPDELQKRLTEMQRRLREQDEHIHDLKKQVDSQASQLQLLDRHLRERDAKDRERDEQLRLRDEQLRERDEQLRLRDEQLRERDAKDRERDQQREAVTSALRPLVEVRARQAGRQDILEQLPAITDNQLLTRWLTELS
jgi:hypothetical protein